MPDGRKGCGGVQRGTWLLERKEIEKARIVGYTFSATELKTR
jgi:hypothetical protein